MKIESLNKIDLFENLNALDKMYFEAIVSKSSKWFVGEIVSKVAKAKGYIYSGYHGSPNKNIIRFKPSLGNEATFKTHDLGNGIYLTQDMLEAGEYASGANRDIDELLQGASFIEKKGRVYSLYIKMEKPFYGDQPIPFDIFKMAQRNIKNISGYKRECLEDEFDSLLNDDGSMNQNISFMELLSGTENIKFWDGILKALKYDGGFEDKDGKGQIVVYSSTQLKLSNSRTYYDMNKTSKLENIIPISKRFDSLKNDIRF